MSVIVSTSEKKPYGVERVCKAWRVSSSTVYRHLKEASEAPDNSPRRRRGPTGAMPDAQMIEAIKQVIKDSPFHGEGYRKVEARLRCKGIRTSRARVLRLMRENGLLAKTCRGPAHGPRSHDGTIIPSKVDEMWGTDMTTTTLGTGKLSCRLRGHRPSLGRMRGAARGLSEAPASKRCSPFAKGC